MKMSGFSKVKIVAAAAVILAAAGIGGWLYQSSVNKDTRVKASGTVEVTEIQLAPQAGGRIVEINIKAADFVKKGDLLINIHNLPSTNCLYTAFDFSTKEVFCNPYTVLNTLNLHTSYFLKPPS